MQHVAGWWITLRLTEVRKLSKQNLTHSLLVIMKEIYQKPVQYCGVWSFLFMWVESLLIPKFDERSGDPKNDYMRI
jgi:hypothetical protein